MRRQRAMGIPQALYTSGHTMPTPFVTSHYMNRFLNPTKLVECKYTNMPANMSFKDFNRKHRLPDKKTINLIGNVRRMTKKDVAPVLKLWNA